MPTLLEKLMAHTNEVKDKTADLLKVAQDSEMASQVLSATESLSEKASGTIDAVAKGVGETYSRTIGALLGESTIQESLVEAFSNLHSHAQESDAYRAAIDSLAHAKGFGGAAFHRIADGQHSLAGAMDAIRENCPDADFGDRLTGAFSHLMADFNSRVGIPVVSFDSMDQFNAFCDALHLMPEYARDLLTVSGSEVLGSALTIIPALFRFNEMQADEFAALAGRLGILTAFGGGQAEIISGLFSLAMLGKAYFMTLHDGESSAAIFASAIKESGWTGGTLVLVGLMPFPFSIAAIFGMTRIRAFVETHGLEGSKEIIQEYASELSAWAKDFDTSSLMKMAG